jgi:hypothetical protein
VLQYVLGLRNLGHDVYLVEPIAPASVRPADAPLAMSINAGYFHDGDPLADGRAYCRQDTKETFGLSYKNLVAAAKDAAVLVNVSGMLTDSQILEAVPLRAYLDLDPAFNQMWHAIEGIDLRFAGHTHFFTVGTAIGSSSCSVPTCGLPWLPTLQPIVLAEWPMTGAIPPERDDRRPLARLWLHLPCRKALRPEGAFHAPLD